MSEKRGDDRSEPPPGYKIQHLTAPVEEFNIQWPSGPRWRHETLAPALIEAWRHYESHPGYRLAIEALHDIGEGDGWPGEGIASYDEGDGDVGFYCAECEQDEGWKEGEAEVHDSRCKTGIARAALLHLGRMK